MLNIASRIDFLKINIVHEKLQFYTLHATFSVNSPLLGNDRLHTHPLHNIVVMALVWDIFVFLELEEINFIESLHPG